METKQDIILSPALHEIGLGNSNEGGNKTVPQNVHNNTDNVNFAVTAMLDVTRNFIFSFENNDMKGHKYGLRISSGTIMLPPLSRHGQEYQRQQLPIRSGYQYFC